MDVIFTAIGNRNKTVTKFAGNKKMQIKSL